MHDEAFSVEEKEEYRPTFVAWKAPMYYLKKKKKKLETPELWSNVIGVGTYAPEGKN